MRSEPAAIARGECMRREHAQHAAEHATRACGKSMRREHAARACGETTRQERSARACGVDMRREHAAKACGESMRKEHAARARGKSMRAARACGNSMRQEHAARTCGVEPILESGAKEKDVVQLTRNSAMTAPPRRSHRQHRHWRGRSQSGDRVGEEGPSKDAFLRYGEKPEYTWFTTMLRDRSSASRSRRIEALANCRVPQRG